jgi:hypothetical protein
VDSRVRVQLSPSPVDHEKYAIRFNQRFTFAKNKMKKIYTFSHTILPIYLPIGIHEECSKETSETSMNN